MPTNAALQEEARSLENELEESMYIPPRKAGAPVIEEVRSLNSSLSSDLPSWLAQQRSVPPALQAFHDLPPSISSNARLHQVGFSFARRCTASF